MIAQPFGGPWSLIKLNVVASYLEKFNTALKFQRFKRVYIDAFAGSGDFTFPASTTAPLFDELEAIQVHAGSARRALETDPPFDRLYFVERRPNNVEVLRALAQKDPTGRAVVIAGDANVEVARICAEIDWRSSRGVIFLDPFGNSVEWSTLRAIAKTEALDVWYLFPLSGVYRNAPIDQLALTPDKKAAVTRVLDTEEWEMHFYTPPPDEQSELFSEAPAAAVGRRALNVDGIEAFVQARLQLIFPLVEKPRRLFGPTRAPLFSLFFAMANPSKRAQAVARPIAQHILRSR